MQIFQERNSTSIHIALVNKSIIKIGGRVCSSLTGRIIKTDVRKVERRGWIAMKTCWTRGIALVLSSPGSFVRLLECFINFSVIVCEYGKGFNFLGGGRVN